MNKTEVVHKHSRLAEVSVRQTALQGGGGGTLPPSQMIQY